MSVMLAQNLAMSIPPGATTTQTSPDFQNTSARGVKVVLNMTAVGTGSVTLSIQGRDKASGAYYLLLASLPVTANGPQTFTVYPGLTSAANLIASDVLPATWRIVCTANNSNPTTYTVGASL